MCKKEDGFSIYKNAVKSEKELTDEQLKGLQNLYLNMLKDFIKVADKNEISYTLSGGSVLGTIRHGGFIPWDDDLDINMSRKEFEKLKRVFYSEFGSKYELYAPELVKGYGYAASQLRKKGTIYKGAANLADPDETCGIGIDIFVIENTFNNSILRKLHGGICLIVGYLLTCRKTYEYFPNIEKYIVKDNKEAKKYFSKKLFIGSILRYISIDKITQLVYKTYTLCKNDLSEYVTIPSGRKHYFGEMAKREDFVEGKDALFEGIKVKIPKRTEEYMERLYGKDYMEIPPESKREKHAIIKLYLGD